jgi:hypothetical protein
MKDGKEWLTEVPTGGHSPAESVDELTDGKQIALTYGSLNDNGEASCSRAISLT